MKLVLLLAFTCYFAALLANVAALPTLQIETPEAPENPSNGLQASESGANSKRAVRTFALADLIIPVVHVAVNDGNAHHNTPATPVPPPVTQPPTTTRAPTAAPAK